MDNNYKEWLVRTRSGEVLGPFTERDLVDELNRNTFSADDEIAPSKGLWISAQTLLNREDSEFTHTHTRNTETTSATGSLNTITETTSSAVVDNDLTPTPEITPRIIQPPRRAPEGAAPSTIHKVSHIGSIIGGICVFAGLAILVSNLMTYKKIGRRPGAHSDLAGKTSSPFLQSIYNLIHSGDRDLALKQLQEFHEKAGKSDLDHLIPYAALLITDGEELLKARQMLEQVIGSPTASRQQKAQAHHWLGYLMLSQDQGDYGEIHFLECLQVFPTDPAARFNLGRAYLKQKKFSQALVYFQLAELEDPDLWLVHLYKAQAKALLGNTEDARASFKTAIQSAPDRWASYIYYALFLTGTHDNQSAKATVMTMLTRDPDYEVQSPAPWGFFQEKVNRAEYLEPFNTIMVSTSGRPEEHELGKLYIRYLMDSSDPDAKRLKSPPVSAGMMAKVIALKCLLDADAAKSDLRNLLNRLPEHLENFGAYAYVLRGDARSRLADYAKAQSDFREALALEPRSAIAHWAYAVFLKKTQHSEEADAEIKNLLSYHPDYIPAIVSAR